MLMYKMRIGFTLPESVLKKIDEKRKDMPRSRYVTRLLEKALEIPEKERTEYV